MKTLAVAFTFAFLAGASLYAQAGIDDWNSGASSSNFRGSHFNDFAVNGKFYHNIKLESVKDGVAELKSNEGRVSTAWSKLPFVFQNEYPAAKANVDAQEAKKPTTGTTQSGADSPPMNLVGASESELTGLFGRPLNAAADSVLPGCMDLTFKASSLVDGQLIMIHATVIDGVCLAILYIKVGTDKTPLPPQEIARWMLIYTQGTAASWKQNGPNKWVLNRGTGVPYTYRAERLQPNTCSIDTQELYDRAPRTEEQAKSDVQKIPGLSATPPAVQASSGEATIPGLDQAGH